MGQPKEWLRWLRWAAALWTIPGCMMGVWGACYAEVYGVPGP
jgi:hypothetical protein